jgi:hypothetical protein
MILIGAGAALSAGQDTALVGGWSTDAVKTAYKASRETSRYSDGFAPPDSFGGVTRKGGSPDGVALVIDFKIDGTTLVGKVTEFVTGAEFEIEAFSGAASKFEFTTNKKILSVRVGTTYRGQQIDAGTIAIERFANGKRIDLKADGSPDILILRRAPASLPAPPPLPPPLLPRAAR